MKNFSAYGMKLPEILLPVKGTDLKSWSVIACDQYTQDREYWLRCEKAAEGKPSTLHIILPEVYLNDADKPDRIKKIHKTMKEYICGGNSDALDNSGVLGNSGVSSNSGVFETPKEAFSYIERKTAYGRTRKGLITAIDLETYEWKPFTKAYIRATEATIVDRIPPRMEIRQGAPIESPHIMLLVDDPHKTLVEGIGQVVNKKVPSYEIDLLENSGSIKGWSVETDAELDIVEKALEGIKKANTADDGSVFMFAVGDGNHSLATAKAVWDSFKKENGGVLLPADVPNEAGAVGEGKISIPDSIKNHNARYALVEIVNIYDEGLTFEPIHRVLFNVDGNDLAKFLQNALNGDVSDIANAEELEKAVAASKADFGIVFKDEATGEKTYKLLKTKIIDLAVSKLQPALDEFLKTAPKMHVCTDDVCAMRKPEIDYIHGSEEVFRLGGETSEAGIGVSILLPPIAKDSFFGTIEGSGPLPRKSFSMGEASEKRFYMECRALF